MFQNTRGPFSQPENTGAACLRIKERRNVKTNTVYLVQRLKNMLRFTPSTPCGFMHGALSTKTKKKLKTKLRGFSPQANYTDRATAACRRS
jgi:hypothetical protein